MRVLVLNPGSATIKATVLEPPDRHPRYERTTTWDTTKDGAHERTVSRLVAEAGAAGPVRAVDTVAYRVVHGGVGLVGPVLIDDAVVEMIASLADLAPLHNPVAAQTIREGRRLMPDVR